MYSYDDYALCVFALPLPEKSSSTVGVNFYTLCQIPTQQPVSSEILMNPADMQREREGDGCQGKMLTTLTFHLGLIRSA